MYKIGILIGASAFSIYCLSLGRISVDIKNGEKTKKINYGNKNENPLFDMKIYYSNSFSEK